jgi:hypothetical protein
MLSVTTDLSDKEKYADEFVPENPIINQKGMIDYVSLTLKIYAKLVVNNL